VHLEQFADRLPSQLSGGQRQRMALARALAVQPEVLLLDEPFGALDAKVRKELRDWLRNLHDEVNVTTIFVTHDQEEALEVSDEIVVINHGRIEQVGSPTDLYDHPANDFVMGFLGPVTRLNGHWVRPHDIEVLSDPHPEGTPATVVRLLRVGFEVRAELTTDGHGANGGTGDGAGDGAGGGRPWVQLTRAQADDLELHPERTVWLRPHQAATRLSAS
jgi:sulfate transport system ATP-binding protein